MSDNKKHLPYIYEFIGTAMITFSFGMTGDKAIATDVYAGLGEITIYLYLIALWLVWNNGPSQFNCSIAFAEIFIQKPEGIEDIKDRMPRLISIALV